MPQTICAFPGCEQPHDAKGLCGGHRQQFRAGKPLKPLQKRDFAERFWAKVDRRAESDCWLWTAATTGRGHLVYGVMGIPPAMAGGKTNRTVRAHRVSYELNVGPIPPGMDVDHICHNTRCVNPKHLRVTTRSQNMQNRQGATARSGSGIRGVMWEGRRNKWRVEVRVNRVLHFGGYFLDIADAERAAIALRLRLMTHNELDRGSIDGAVARVQT